MPAEMTRLRFAVAFAALAVASATVSGSAAAETAPPRAAGSVDAGAGKAPGSPASAAPASSVEAGAPARAGDSPELRLTPRVEVDESALRYYAGQRDEKRVEAETRRLQSLNPGWTPPDDLYAEARDIAPDETQFWDLFTADRMAELRAAIEQRKKDDPGWQPSADLDLKIRRKEARAKVIALWNDKKWKELVAYAQNDPMVAEIGDVDILWTLAEGFANAKQKAGALGIYTSILASSQDAPERIGTMHKAIANLQMADVEKLVAMGKAKDGRNEFDVILVDIARARISAYLHDERLEEVAASDLEAFEAYAREAKDPNQPGLVAWYRYKRQDFKGALDWFKVALAKGGDSMIAHGLAHAARELGYFRETEEVAFAWRQYLTNNRILFIDILERDLTREIPPFVESERLARYGRVAAEDASGEGAQALAWYAYNSCQFEVALEWFERAMAWMPKQETVYGYALTLRKLKRDRQFLEVVNRADGLHPKVVELLFPEERYRPPTPCEVSSWEQARWWEAFLAQNPGLLQNNDAARENAKPLPGRLGVAPIVRHGDGPYTAGYDGFVQGALHDPLQRYSWGVVTGPTGNVYPQWRPLDASFQPPQFNLIQLPTPQQFPLSVLPENPLRFVAQGAPTSQTPPASAVKASENGVYLREPFTGPYPLIARRVPDVGPMPYERFGGVVLPNPEPGKPLGSQPAASNLMRQSSLGGVREPNMLARASADAGKTGEALKTAAADKDQTASPGVSNETTGSIRGGRRQNRGAQAAASLVFAQAPLQQVAPQQFAPAPGAAVVPVAAPAPVQPAPGIAYAPPSAVIYGGAPVQAPAAAQPAQGGRRGRAAQAPVVAPPQEGSLAWPVTVGYRNGPAPTMPGQAYGAAPVYAQNGLYASPPPTTLQPAGVIGQASPYLAAAPSVSPYAPGGQAAPYMQAAPMPVAAAPMPVPAPVYQQAQPLRVAAPAPVMPAWAAQPAPMAYAQQPLQAGYQPQPAQLAYAPQAAPAERAPARLDAPVRRREARAPVRQARGSAGGSGGGSCSLGASGVAAEFSAGQAVANGWCLLNAGRPSEAAIAFERGLGAPGRTGGDAAYGKSLALLRLNDARGAAQAGSSLSGERRNQIGAMSLEQRVFSSYDKGAYRETLGLLDQRAAHATETRDLTLMRAWAHFQLGRTDEAERLFRSLDRQMSTRQTRSGLAAIENKRTRMAY